MWEDRSLWVQSKFFSMSSLKKKIIQDIWLGSEVPGLKISGEKVLLYLLGHCAFPLQKNLMKTTPKSEKAANPVLPH